MIGRDGSSEGCLLIHGLLEIKELSNLTALTRSFIYVLKHFLVAWWLACLFLQPCLPYFIGLSLRFVTMEPQHFGLCRKEGQKDEALGLQRLCSIHRLSHRLPPWPWPGLFIYPVPCFPYFRKKESIVRMDVLKIYTVKCCRWGSYTTQDTFGSYAVYLLCK